MPSLTLTSADLPTLGVDAVVVAIAPAGGRRKGAVVVGPASPFKAVPARRLQESLDAVGATGKAGETVRVPGNGIVAAPFVLAVGLGRADGSWSGEELRRAAGNAARELAGTRRAAFALPAVAPAEVQAVVEGAALGAYDFTAFRTDSAAGRPAPLRSATFVVPDARDPEARAALARARVVAEAVSLARDLINTPPLSLAPADLAAAAVMAADGVADLEVEVLDDTELRAGGYGGLIGVGQGSTRGPRLVRMAYRPAGATRHLALVGKGITFDTGGISLKPPANMHEMKGDMGGAAAVIAATAAIARLGIAVNVTGYAACAENMPGGAAQRPGDVITIYGGKTVEVLNTDAEGRLVLSDALVRAQEDDPDLIIDIATLTGAQVIALGARTTGIMANDDDLRAAVHDAAGRAGETTWPMPLPEELRSHLDSTTADIANVATKGAREAGMLLAGVFLRDFVPDSRRWAHLDIAGPSFNTHAPYGYVAKGGTGVGVRTFVQLAADLADGTAV